MKTYLQNRSKNRSFSKDRSFTVRGLFVQKSVFLTHHVVHSIRVNWKSERSLNFSSSRMPWLYRPKNVSRGLVHSNKSGPKSVRASSCGVPYFRQRFLSVAHTKCPSGNNTDVCDLAIRYVASLFDTINKTRKSYHDWRLVSELCYLMNNNTVKLHTGTVFEMIPVLPIVRNTA